MANIFNSTKFFRKRDEHESFRVEWREDCDLTRERYFGSFQEALRFAREIEHLLLKAAIQDVREKETRPQQAKCDTRGSK